MAPKTAVIAIGGNSLILDKNQPQVERQWEATYETARHIADMIAEGWRVVLTHGNGPQVGFILRRNELAAHEVHTTPMDLIGADTQGSIGYMLQQALGNCLRERGITRNICTVITQTLVDRNDPAFQRPNKPIGGFMSKEQGEKFEAEGWAVVEDAGRGYRRVVASPIPVEILELDPINTLVTSEVIVICTGGGGIPVIRDEQGDVRGVNAVIDKDRGSSLLASGLKADLFVISTAVEKVAINFNKPDQKWLDRMTLAEAKQYLAEGHFAPGSMAPKIEAIISFIENGGPQAIITDPASISRALRGETGTTVVPV
ncbi:MAG: carbamate kinase [Chloroflexota bacterium]|nr:carbamate kinase [Anaerolineae bacterium]HMM26994.1 carbamate kinase [Aggregatilineaceae bacterium]